MKPIIGIVVRPVLSEENNKMYGVYEDIIKSVKKFGGIPISIFPFEDNFYEDISLCDGLIFQGGDYHTEYEKKCLEYAYKNNKPTLGICLGMQLMGCMFGGEEYDVLNHKIKNKKYVHKVLIDEKSKLYSILETKEILVNSRHKSAIKNTKLDVVGISQDGIVEAIEDKTKRFFIGVEWHPENMIDYDISSRKLFDFFISICKK